MNQSLIHADIFFFITTVVVIVLAILLIFALVFIIEILRDARDITRKFKKESEEVLGDLHDLREHIKQEGLTIGYMGKFFKRLFKKKN